MFIAVLFVLAKNWKQLERPLIGEQIMVHTHHRIAVKTNYRYTNDLDKSPENYAWVKKSQSSKVCILYDYINITENYA